MVYWRFWLKSKFFYRSERSVSSSLRLVLLSVNGWHLQDALHFFTHCTVLEGIFKMPSISTDEPKRQPTQISNHCYQGYFKRPLSLSTYSQTNKSGLQVTPSNKDLLPFPYLRVLPFLVYVL